MFISIRRRVYFGPILRNLGPIPTMAPKKIPDRDRIVYAEIPSGGPGPVVIARPPSIEIP